MKHREHPHHSATEDRSTWQATVEATRRWTPGIHRGVAPNLVLVLTLAPVVGGFAPGWVVVSGTFIGAIALVTTARWIGRESGYRTRSRIASGLRRDVTCGASIALTGLLAGSAAASHTIALAVPGAVGCALLALLIPFVLGRVGTADEGVAARWRVAAALLASSPERTVLLAALGTVAIVVCVLTAGALGLLLPTWWLHVVTEVTGDASDRLRTRLHRQSAVPVR